MAVHSLDKCLQDNDPAFNFKLLAVVMTNDYKERIFGAKDSMVGFSFRPTPHHTIIHRGSVTVGRSERGRRTTRPYPYIRIRVLYLLVEKKPGLLDITAVR
jgi:hypothetical protein